MQYLFKLSYLLTEDTDKKFSDNFVHKNDTMEFHKQESTTYLLGIAVVGLSFVVIISILRMFDFSYEKNRAPHEDFMIINE